VHGTCRANPRDFIGIRIIWCGTRDSPRGHGGRRVTAAAGWTVEWSQTKESTETATTVPLPGTVPAVADTGEMMWTMAGKTGLLRPWGAWHLSRKSQRFYWYTHHLVRHRGQSPRARRRACTSGRWLDGRIVTIRRVHRNRNDCAVARDSPCSRRHRGNEVGRGRKKTPVIRP